MRLRFFSWRCAQSGKTALHFAKERDAHDIVQLLEVRTQFQRFDVLSFAVQLLWTMVSVEFVLLAVLDSSHVLSEFILFVYCVDVAALGDFLPIVLITFCTRVSIHFRSLRGLCVKAASICICTLALLFLPSPMSLRRKHNANKRMLTPKSSSTQPRHNANKLR